MRNRIPGPTWISFFLFIQSISLFLIFGDKNHADSYFGIEKVCIHINTLPLMNVPQSLVVHAHVRRPHLFAFTLTGGF